MGISSVLLCLSFVVRQVKDVKTGDKNRTSLNSTCQHRDKHFLHLSSFHFLHLVSSCSGGNNSLLNYNLWEVWRMILHKETEIRCKYLKKCFPQIKINVCFPIGKLSHWLATSSLFVWSIFTHEKFDKLGWKRNEVTFQTNLDVKDLKGADNRNINSMRNVLLST